MRYGIRDIVDVTIKDISTKKPKLFLESLKTSSTEVGAETVYARGSRGNPRLVAWDGTKDVSFKCEDALISPEALALLAGSTMSTGIKYVPVTEIGKVTVGNSATIVVTGEPTADENITFTINGTAHTVAVLDLDNKAQVAYKIASMLEGLSTPSYTVSVNATLSNPLITFTQDSGTLATVVFAAGTSGATATATVYTTTVVLTNTPYVADLVNYPISIFTTIDRSIPILEQTVGNPTNANEYSITGANITINNSFAINDEFIITYYIESSVTNKQIKITSDEFPLTFELSGYTLWRDELTGKDYPCRITIPKAKLLAPFTITQAATGDPSTFAFNFEVLKDGRSTDMVIYNVDEGSPIN